MWPFKKKAAKPADKRADTLRWMASNICGTSWCYSGDMPNGAGIDGVKAALRELADRIDAEATQESKEGGE